MEKLLDVKLTAEWLGVRPATLYTWVYRRQIPFQKVRGALRFSPSRLREWLENQTRDEADHRTGAKSGAGAGEPGPSPEKLEHIQRTREPQ